MDTQAMTFGGKSIPSDIQAQRDAIPPMVVNKTNLLSDALKVELKQLLINYKHHHIQLQILH